MRRRLALRDESVLAVFCHEAVGERVIIPALAEASRAGAAHPKEGADPLSNNRRLTHPLGASLPPHVAWY